MGHSQTSENKMQNLAASKLIWNEDRKQLELIERGHCSSSISKLFQKQIR
jgi:hypothetical protein